MQRGEDMLKLCLFLLVLNFDAFLSGLALGVAGIRAKAGAAALVALFSAGFFGASLWLGEGLLSFLPVNFLHKVGLVILVLLTLLWIGKFCGKDRGGFAGMWRTPQNLDVNADKHLSTAEAALLALALALDSLGGGLAFGLLGEKPLLWSGLAAVLTYALFMSANWLGRFVRRAVKEDE